MLHFLPWIWLWITTLLLILGRNTDYLAPRLNHQVNLISGSFFTRPLEIGKSNVYYFHGKQSLKRVDGYTVAILEMFPAFLWLIFISTEGSLINPGIHSYRYSFSISLLQDVVYSWSAWSQELNSNSLHWRLDAGLFEVTEKTPIEFSSLKGPLLQGIWSTLTELMFFWKKFN